MGEIVVFEEARANMRWIAKKGSPGDWIVADTWRPGDFCGGEIRKPGGEGRGKAAGRPT